MERRAWTVRVRQIFQASRVPMPYRYYRGASHPSRIASGERRMHENPARPNSHLSFIRPIGTHRLQTWAASKTASNLMR